MQTDADLPTLIQRKDHLNVLRYIRVHQLREPELVVKHGKSILGQDLKRSGGVDEPSKLAALEQLCLASLDCHDSETAQMALVSLASCGVNKESARFQRLTARMLEAKSDFNGAELIYDEMLKENPSNLHALKRKYCIQKSQVGRELSAMEALNVYLKQAYGDSAAWYEMAQLRLSLGDYKGASFALEEVLLTAPAESKIHCELAECYATMDTGSNAAEGRLNYLGLARKHMAQALELDPTNRRAMFGLVCVSNSYVEEASASKKQVADEYEVEVAKELIKYGAEKVLASYKGTSMYAGVQNLMKKYTSSQ